MRRRVKAATRVDAIAIAYRKLMAHVVVTPGPLATDCLITTYRGNQKGYPQLLVDDQPTRVHRLAWEHINGPIPAGMQVLHKCDRPPCVEIEHLFLGTNADNVADKMAKGRHVAGVLFGEANPNSKLTDAEVAEVARLYATTGLSHRQLARQFNVGQSTIARIARREHIALAQNLNRKKEQGNG